MLALVNPAALPALQIAGMFFLVINLVAGAYIFRNRNRFFGRDPDVSDDIPAVRVSWSSCRPNRISPQLGNARSD